MNLNNNASDIKHNNLYATTKEQNNRNKIRRWNKHTKAKRRQNIAGLFKNAEWKFNQ